MSLAPAAWPRPLRLAAYGAAVSVLLYLCLAPSDALPKEHIWDKAEHSLAWAVLAGLGLLLSPRRPRAIAAFSLGLGAAVELMQATMGFGRDGDWRDLVADAIGVAVALLIWALVRAAARGLHVRAA